MKSNSKIHVLTLKFEFLPALLNYSSISSSPPAFYTRHRLEGAKAIDQVHSWHIAELMSQCAYAGFDGVPHAPLLVCHPVITKVIEITKAKLAQYSYIWPEKPPTKYLPKYLQSCFDRV